MNIFDETYYETNKETLREEYVDFLTIHGMTEEEFSFFDFI